jgi:nucleoside phosphorylase
LRGELPSTRPRGRVGAARVAIVTITEGEFLAAQTVLGLQANVAGSAYFCGRVTANNNYQVVLRRAAAQGNIEAAQAVGSAVEDFRPDYIFLVGTAGGSGKDDGHVGDVVVADVVAYYEHRKYVGGRDLARRTPCDQPSLFLRERFVEPLRVDGSWVAHIPGAYPRPEPGVPKVLIGEIVAGEKLLGDADNAYQAAVMTEYDKALAFDMESWGIAKEIYLHRGTPGYNPQYLVIRGISDIVSDPVNNDQRVRWRDYASAAAAAVAHRVIKLLVETSEPER